MASKPAARAVTSLVRRPRRCMFCAPSSTASVHARPSRPYSTTPLDDLSPPSSSLPSSSSSADPAAQTELPRWSQTPPQMLAPFHPRIKDPRKAWSYEDDPQKLDAMYVRLLGDGGHKLLTEEVKWLAVTHKSFDQGRRGFNDRLAYFGKRILMLQATTSLLQSPAPGPPPPAMDPFGRTPYSHPALDGLQNLSNVSITTLLSKERLGQLAASYGIGNVTRWKPRNPANLVGSGRDVVYTQSLLAILGAVALQRGGERANEIARERILKPLGV